jgi:hypothetical protein
VRSRLDRRCPVLVSTATRGVAVVGAGAVVGIERRWCGVDVVGPASASDSDVELFRVGSIAVAYPFFAVCSVGEAPVVGSGDDCVAWVEHAAANLDALVGIEVSGVEEPFGDGGVELIDEGVGGCHHKEVSSLDDFGASGFVLDRDVMPRAVVAVDLLDDADTRNSRAGNDLIEAITRD